MDITVTYRPGAGVTVAGPHARAARDLMSAGMTWSVKQRAWFAAHSRLDPDRLEQVATALEAAGHTVTRDLPTLEPPPQVTPTDGTRLFDHDTALRTQIAGLTEALAGLDPDRPGVKAIRDRLARATARLDERQKQTQATHAA